MKNLTRRGFLLGVGAALGAIATRFFSSNEPTLDGTYSLAPSAADQVLNDASGLSQTPIHKHVTVTERPGEPLIQQMRAELFTAASQGRPVNIGAARHSMGGHAIPREGHAITYRSDYVEPDQSAQLYRAHAGSRWSDVIKTLDAIGYSPKVMQSNNDFGVASTFCVNAHGWPVPYGPMGSTVRSFRMLMADGDLVECSASANADLFSMTMGGYGLSGLITDMTIEMVPNRRLVASYLESDSSEFADHLIHALESPAVEMAYGRLNVDRLNFFSNSLLVTFKPTDYQDDLPAASSSDFVSKSSRHIFRGQLGNENWKELRWGVETEIGPLIDGGTVTRNSLLNEPVVTLDDNDPRRTDILHEYFVSPERFPEFVRACQEVIPASYQELLNVTLRYVEKDTRSILCYATEPRIAAVMLFSQEMTERAEADMARMTRELIERVLEMDGTYYLPYRPHATVDQFVRAYPRAEEFAARKRSVDPGLRFQNHFWDTYLEKL